MNTPPTFHSYALYGILCENAALSADVIRLRNELDAANYRLQNELNAANSRTAMQNETIEQLMSKLALSETANGALHARLRETDRTRASAASSTHDASTETEPESRQHAGTNTEPLAERATTQDASTNTRQETGLNQMATALLRQVRRDTVALKSDAWKRVAAASLSKARQILRLARPVLKSDAWGPMSTALLDSATQALREERLTLKEQRFTNRARSLWQHCRVVMLPKLCKQVRAMERAKTGRRQKLHSLFERAVGRSKAANLAHRKSVLRTHARKLCLKRSWQHVVLAVRAQAADDHYDKHRKIAVKKMRWARKWCRTILMYLRACNYNALCVKEKKRDMARLKKKFLAMPVDERDETILETNLVITELWSILRRRHLNCNIYTSKLKRFHRELHLIVFNNSYATAPPLPEGSDVKDYTIAVESMVNYGFLRLADVVEGFGMLFYLPHENLENMRMEVRVSSITAIANIHYATRERVMSLYESYFEVGVQKRKEEQTAFFGSGVDNAFMAFLQICTERYVNRLTVKPVQEDKRGLKMISVQVRMVRKGDSAVLLQPGTQTVCTVFEAHEKLERGFFDEQVKEVQLLEKKLKIEHQFGAKLQNWKVSR